MDKLKLIKLKIVFVLSILFISSGVFAQIEIKGQVTDEANEPLVGVTVVEKGTTNGVATDVDGKYSVTVSSQNSVLVFSFIAMKTKEVPLNGQTILNVVMESDVIGLDEVVAVGYGSMKRSDLTGSVVSVQTGDEELMGQTTISDLLKGRAAGVQVAGSNVAGEAESIRIRGVSSINASSEPLFVVDGFPIMNSGTSSASGVNRIGAIANIDPNTIESIEVLKDASATAIYGSQGANGVILITTKKAKEGQSTVNFKFNTGVTLLENNYQSMDANQFAYYVRNAIVYPYPFAHDRVPTDPKGWGTKFYFPDRWKTAPTTDWMDIVTRRGSFQEYSLNMSESTSNSSFTANLGYLQNKGVINGTQFDRYTLDMGGDLFPNDRLKLYMNSRLSYINNDGVITQSNPTQATYPAGPVMGALSFDPTIVYDPNTNEQFYYYPDGSKTISPAINLAEQMRNTKRFDGSLSAGFLAYFLKDKSLTFDSRLSGRYGGTKNNSFDSKYTFNGMTNGGEYGAIANVRNEFTLFTMWNNVLTYNKDFGKHKLNFMGGQEYQHNYWENQGQVSKNFQIDDLGVYNLGMGDPESHETPYTGAGEWTILSYFGRMNYNYSERYLFTFTYRADGSSRFSKNNKWGYFPSTGIAWRATEEDFMMPVKSVINNLKLRVGWGVTGNQSINPYESQALMSTTGNYYPQGVQTMGLRANRLANDDLRWETTTQTNLGLDMSFLDSKVNVTVDLYNKITKDLLMPLNIPPSSGFDRITTNVGQISNRGLELLINTTNIKTNDFAWTTTFNFAHNKNNVDDLGDSGEIYRGGTNYQQIIKEGEPLGSWYGLVTDGLWTQDDISFTRRPDGSLDLTIIPGREHAVVPGDLLRYGNLKIKDISGVDGVPDGIISDLDRVIIGRSQPKFFGGIDNTFRYKNFSLKVFCDYSFGNEVFNHMKQEFVAVKWPYNHFSVDYYFPTQYELIENADGLFVEDKTSVINPGNPDGKYPIEATRLAGLGGYTLDMFVEDASFFRVKELNLTYDLPRKILQRTFFSGGSINLKATNLYTFTKYSGNDPTSVQDRDWNPYPRARSFQLGLHFTL